MAAAAILNFVVCKFWRQNCFREVILSLCVKFGVNTCNSAIMAHYGKISKWRPPPSWILSDVKSDGKCVSGTWFWVPVQNSVRPCAKMTDLRPFNWISKWLPRHLRFCPICIWLHNILWASFSVTPSNLVKMPAAATELWPSKKRPPPSWILPEVKSDGKPDSGTWLWVPLQNFVHIRAKMTELWSFN